MPVHRKVAGNLARLPVWCSLLLESIAIVIVATGDADVLFPPLVSSAVGRQITGQIYDYLAEVGPQMNTVGGAAFRPRLARSRRRSPDSLAISFRLDSSARWHDGRRVRSDDVSFTFAIYTDSTLGSRPAPSSPMSTRSARPTRSPRGSGSREVAFSLNDPVL